MSGNDTNSTLAPAEQLFKQWHGQLVPWSYEPGFVILSYVVSFIGAATTLELIQRRTAQMGKLNNVLLIGAAISMGGVAIWSMHYVGNRAIIIAGGELQLQIAYSGGFTTLSLFVPIIVLLAAFVATGTKDRVSWWRVAVGGTLAGLAICGMHYLGNASISNYACEYEQANIIAAGIIAVVASTIALALFFIFRATWTSAWWKRTISEIILAGAVSGMHWCASAGTQYRLVALKSNNGNELSRNTTVIIVICLAVGASILMAGLAIYMAYLTKRYASRARKVQLAAAVFDSQGRVLVNPDGFLPSEKITDSFLETSPQDAFGTAHPLFHWMFQVSRNWQCVSPLLEEINSHLARLSGGPRRALNRTSIHRDRKENYDTTVRQLFCAAAGTLAARLKTNIEQAGVLWDDVLVTGGLGGVKSRARGWGAQGRDSDGSATDYDLEGVSDLGHAEKGFRFWVETGNDGYGSLLFLVRQAGSGSEAEALEAAGYRFAELHQVSSIISTRMQIRTPDLEGKLRNMATHARQQTMLAPGLHLGLFGVHARSGVFGFDVLVQKGTRNLMPSVPMDLDKLEKWHIDYLEQLDRMSINAMLHVLESGGEGPKGGESAKGSETAVFARKLGDTLEALRASVNDPTLAEAMVTSKVVQVPCSKGEAEEDGPAPTATMIALRIVIPGSHVVAGDSECELVPLGLFKVHQLAYKGSPHNAAFVKGAERELNPATPADRKHGSLDKEIKTAGSGGVTETVSKVVGSQLEDAPEETRGRWNSWKAAAGRRSMDRQRASRARSAGGATTPEGSPRESKQSTGSSTIKLWRGDDEGSSTKGSRASSRPNAGAGGSGLAEAEGQGRATSRGTTSRRRSAIEMLVRRAGGHGRGPAVEERDAEAGADMEMGRLSSSAARDRQRGQGGSQQPEMPNFVDELFTLGRY